MCEEDVPTDPLVELLIAKKFATNRFLLELNGGLEVPADFELSAPWSLPSRMFQWPIEVQLPAWGSTHPAKIGLMHPDLGDHPFVKHVEAALGYRIPSEPATNDCGYSKSRLAVWWHAVDLANAGHWQGLKDTARFTTPDLIFRAINHSLRYACREDGRGQRKLVLAARDMMAWLGSGEPEDQVASVRKLGVPQKVGDEKGARWPINYSGEATSEQEAWALLHGVTGGWITYDRSGYAQWSELGQSRYVAPSDEAFTETTGQHAFAF